MPIFIQCKKCKMILIVSNSSLNFVGNFPPLVFERHVIFLASLTIIFTSFELFCCQTMNNLFTSESSMKRATMQHSMFAEGAICVKIRTAEYTSRLGPCSSLVLLSMSLIFRIMNKDYS